MSQRGNVAFRRGNRADHRRSLSRTCARLARRHGSCDLTLSPADVWRSATGVVACASMPCAWRLVRRRAGHCPTRPCRVSPRGLSQPSSVCRSHARVCRADSGLGRVFSRSRQWLSRAQPQTWLLAHQCQVHRALRVIAVAVSQRDYVASRRGTEPTIVDRRHSRARVCRADSGPVFSRSRRWLSPRRHGVVACTSVPSARRLARHRAGNGPTRPCRVSPRGLSQPSSVAVPRVARLSRRLGSGSCVLTVASAVVSRAATDMVACASVPSARRLAHHRAGHEPARLCPVSPQVVS